MIQFFMAMDPPTTTAQQHKVVVRNGKPVFYDPDDLKAARAKLKAHLAKHRPASKINSGVRLMVKWCFPVTAGHKHGDFRITKPDTDNLQKLLKDCMTACGFWEDDALVASEIVEKLWSDVPGIWIRLEELK